MALQKNVVSDKTGAALGYHEVQRVVFSEGSVDVAVASYVDAAARQSGKAFVEMNSHSFPHDGSAIAVSPVAFAEDALLGTQKFQGATKV